MVGDEAQVDSIANPVVKIRLGHPASWVLGSNESKGQSPAKAPKLACNNLTGNRGPPDKM